MPDVSKLRDKLNTLYTWAWPELLDAEIRARRPQGDRTGDQRLARFLGIAPNNLSTWINGVPDVRAGEMVPDHQSVAICEAIFRIPRDLFEKESLQALQQWCDEQPAPPFLMFDELVAQAQEASLLQIERERLPARGGHGDRGLRLPAEPFPAPLPSYQVDEQIALLLNLHGTDWQPRTVKGVGMLVLMLDAEARAVLCPMNHSLVPPPYLRDAKPVRLPTDGWMHLTAPQGEQTLLAVLTEHELSEDLIKEIKDRRVDATTLDHLATVLCRGRFGAYGAYKRVIEVV